jgi:pantothenate kinase
MTREPNAGNVAPEHASTSQKRIRGDVNLLTDRIRTLADQRDRIIIGITGAPGAGKSTLAEKLATALPGSVVIPMDGFHLSNQALRELNMHTRKGSIDTFDLAGYRALLERVRAGEAGTIYAPAYYRDVEEAIAGVIAVSAGTRIIITEGNYLLADHPDMRRARPLFDETWYVEIDEELRQRRLVGRHICFGKSRAEARDWVANVDQTNAELIRASRPHADFSVQLP